MSLLFSRNFGPLMAAQFLSAFNDNLYRTAMVFLISFQLLRDQPDQAAALATLGAGIFILPFFLFSGMAGELADTRDKAAITRVIKAVEIGILGVGAWALFTDSVMLLMIVLFLTGTHSAFFGPIKYSILPQHLPPQLLLKGTAWVEAGTFMAILLGQIAGGLVGHSGAAFGMVAVAFAGWLFSLFIPPAPPVEPGRRADLNPWTSSVKVVRASWADGRQREAIIAISWFWAMGAVFTAGFVPLVSTRLLASPAVATLFLTVFSVGIAAGSLAINRIMKGSISGRLAPATGVALAASGALLYLGIQLYDAPSVPIGVAAFLARADGWLILAALLGISVAGGMFIVPLYALLQTAAGAAERSRAIAANNIINAAAMVLASGVSAALLAAGLGIAEVLLLVGLLNLLIALRLRRNRALLAAV
ncbi:MFS transporter [Sandaracinobacteroides saxicola]|uniref:MFS transporter n=1 Tax=Sandaracinobacteroides saxicola TaxID=2759707 RepID=A0A7G5IHJ9_9SPHN|nr:MFS transporter [Sandaracinobacteroides saxicola]QMW22841.1 MFS transporter [Sandaracinobacteroides saxicola]